MAHIPQSTEFRYRDDPRTGAVWLLVMAGVLFVASLISGAWGIAALVDSTWLHTGDLPVGDNVGWGVLMLVLATFQGVTALLVLFGRPLGTYLGIAVATVSLLSHVGAIMAYPIGSGIAIIVNAGIVAVLVKYGPRHR
jgi:hypothetical protein